LVFVLVEFQWGVGSLGVFAVVACEAKLTQSVMFASIAEQFC
jgi:hypothetical protein